MQAVGYDIGATRKKTRGVWRDYLFVPLDNPSFPATVYTFQIEGKDGANDLLLCAASPIATSQHSEKCCLDPDRNEKLHSVSGGFDVEKINLVDLNRPGFPGRFIKSPSPFYSNGDVTRYFLQAFDAEVHFCVLSKSPYIRLFVSIPANRTIIFRYSLAQHQFQIDKLPTKSPNVTINIIGSIGEGSNPTRR